MDNKGREALEYFMTYGWILVVIAIVGCVIFILSSPRDNRELAAENFCRAWTKENGVIYLNADFYFNSFDKFSGLRVECEYSNNAIFFDKGISPGEKREIIFLISEEALLDWIDEGESKNCCEVCD